MKFLVGITMINEKSSMFLPCKHGTGSRPPGPATQNSVWFLSKQHFVLLTWGGKHHQPRSRGGLLLENRFLLRWLVAYAPALYPHYFCWRCFWWPPYGRPCLRVHSWTQIPTKTTMKYTKISITNVIYCKTEKWQNLLHTFPNLTFRPSCTLTEI